MQIADAGCHQVAVGRVYRHMATDQEGARQPRMSGVRYPITSSTNRHNFIQMGKLKE